MGFYDDIKVLDTILGIDGKHKLAKKVRYPSKQKVKILTIHLRREYVPRQLNITSGKELKTWMFKEDKFNWFFRKTLLRNSIRQVGICKHCITGVWAYMRVGTKTHVLWLKGENKDIHYVKEGSTSEISRIY